MFFIVLFNSVLLFKSLWHLLMSLTNPVLAILKSLHNSSFQIIQESTSSVVIGELQINIVGYHRSLVFCAVNNPSFRIEGRKRSLFGTQDLRNFTHGWLVLRKRFQNKCQLLYDISLFTLTLTFTNFLWFCWLLFLYHFSGSTALSD